MSKAFVMVNFLRLCVSEICLILLSDFCCSGTATMQHLVIRWNSILSSPFSVSNGVWQGGVLSPVLFSVYIDELLQRLQTLGVGCHWEGMFVGSLCYAK